MDATENKKRAKKRRVSSAPPFPALILSETVGILFVLIPSSVPWLACIGFLRWIWNDPFFFPKVLLLPVIPVPAYLIGVFFFRLLIPRLKQGVYRVGPNRGFLSWYLNLLLNRSIRASGLCPLIQGSYLLKFIYWRIMGARVAYRVNSSMDVALTDLPMIEIGEGSTIADETHISCHTLVGDALVVDRVRIGKNVFVGIKNLIGPRTQIGDGAWIGMGNVIHQKIIPPEGRVEDFQL